MWPARIVTVIAVCGFTDGNSRLLFGRGWRSTGPDSVCIAATHVTAIILWWLGVRAGLIIPAAQVLAL